MPGLLGSWNDASLGKKIGLVAVSSLAVGGVVYGVYLLKAQKAKPPPRPSTPVRRVDPFETESQPPKTPPKTLPKPKVPVTKPEETCDPEVLNLSEKDVPVPKTPPSSPNRGESPTSQPLSASSLASFEPISMSQVSSMPPSGDAPSMPDVKLSPQNIQYGSLNTTSLGPDSGSFVKLSMPPEAPAPTPAPAPAPAPKPEVQEQSIAAESSQPAFSAVPPPKADPPSPSPQSPEVTTPSTADTTISFVQLSKEEARDDDSGSGRGIEEELEAIQRRRAAEEEEELDDATTMATIGSEHGIGEMEDIGPDFESEINADEEEEEDRDSQSGDSDIQRLDEEPAAAEPPKPESTQAGGDTQATLQPPSTQASAAGDGKLKEKDENDIVVISSDEKEGGQ